MVYGYGQIAHFSDGYCCEAGYDTYKDTRRWTEVMTHGSNRPIELHTFEPS